MVCNPKHAIVGQPVSVAAQVTNTGGTGGSYDVKLNIGSSIEESRNIFLEPGGSQLISFNVVKDAPGAYQVAVDGLTDVFNLSLPAVYWIILASLAAITLLLGLLLGYSLAGRRKELPRQQAAMRIQAPVLSEKKPRQQMRCGAR